MHTPTPDPPALPAIDRVRLREMYNNTTDPISDRTYSHRDNLLRMLRDLPPTATVADLYAALESM